MSDFEVHRPRKVPGRVESVLVSTGEGFQTAKTETIQLTFEGIVGDLHAGHTRAAGGREPWYPRGMDMRNTRQITIVAPDELAEAAAAMEIDRIAPEWIGANMVIDGMPNLTMIPPSSRFFFEGGATLGIEGLNGPCRFAGAEIARHYPDRDGLDLLFPKVAQRLRGLLAWVEKPGEIKTGETVEARIPEQWIY